MFRGMTTALIVALVGFAADPAFAETKKQRLSRCTAQSEVVAQLVEMRLRRKSEAKAKAAVMETVDDAIAPSVPMLVAYIYTLSRKDLKSFDVPASFKEQCTAFKG